MSNKSLDASDNSTMMTGHQATNQHITFFVGDEVFAISMHPLKEIIRLPKINKMPLSPPSFEGLANLRGSVLPIINQRRVFGFPDREPDEATRVLIIDCGMYIGFIVDKVSRVINVDPSQIETGQSIQTAVDSELLEGVIKEVAGYNMMMLMDFNKILNNEFKCLSEVVKSYSKEQTSVEKTVEKTVIDIVQLVSFEIAEQEYAIPIEQTQEIVQVPKYINHIPKSAEHVLGIITLRNRLLPLVSLRKMFSLPQPELTERNRIVVVAFREGEENLVVGIVTDNVNEVLRVERKYVEEMPAFLARDQKLDEISAICRLNGGKRLMSVISVAKLFAHHGVRDAVKVAQIMQEEKTMDSDPKAITTQDEQYVIFRLVNEEFGVPITVVKEIVRFPEQLTHIPKAPAFIEGIINLRGTVLPVIDQRLRLGLPRIEHNDKQRIMVFSIGGLRTGFVVDSVLEVLKIPTAAIKAAPEVSEESARLIKYVANLEQQGRMILLLDVEELLESHEISELSNVSTH